MLTKSVSALVLLVAATSSQTACVPAAISSAGLSPVSALDHSYPLGPGDRIRITLYGDESFSGEYSVSPSGLISLPLIGDLSAQGKSIAMFRNMVSDHLADGYYNDPRVSAEITEFRPFYILGEVNRPGEYPYSTDLTLSKAVAVAGGYTYRANEKTISIQRAGNQSRQRVKVDQTIRLGPGDVIVILERYF